MVTAPPPLLDVVAIWRASGQRVDVTTVVVITSGVRSGVLVFNFHCAKLRKVSGFRCLFPGEMSSSSAGEVSTSQAPRKSAEVPPQT